MTRYRVTFALYFPKHLYWWPGLITRFNPAMVGYVFIDFFPSGNDELGWLCNQWRATNGVG